MSIQGLSWACASLVQVATLSLARRHRSARRPCRVRRRAAEGDPHPGLGFDRRGPLPRRADAAGRHRGLERGCARRPRHARFDDRRRAGALTRAWRLALCEGRPTRMATPKKKNPSRGRPRAIASGFASRACARFRSGSPTPARPLSRLRLIGSRSLSPRVPMRLRTRPLSTPCPS